MIKIENLSYHYPKSAWCLKNINVHIAKGECVALSGVNGSGKTTLSKLIAGILRPVEGKIYLQNKDSSQMTLGEIGTKVGFLFQEPSRQLFAVTVKEELTFAEVFKGVDENIATKKAEELLEKFDMLSLQERTVVSLSRGEKQRLAICALLCNNPQVIILDEPTSGLDQENVEKLSALIEELKEQSKTLIIISHDPKFIQKHCTKILHVKEGVIDEN